MPLRSSQPSRRSARDFRSPSPISTPNSSGSSLEQSETTYRTYFTLPQEKPEPQLTETCDERCWLRQCANIATPDAMLTKLDNLGGRPQAADLSSESSLYQPLAACQTRLVVLDPGRIDSTLSCSLVEVVIIDDKGLGIIETGKAVAYEALSYWWDGTERDHYLTCNGQSLRVPAQLTQALHHLRLPDRRRYLWCDAICINQDDVRERSLQVRNMYRIYKKAERTIAYLGELPTQSAQLIQALRSSTDPSLPRLWYWQKHNSMCHITAFKIKDMLADLLSRPWFRRSWTRQEVHAAKVIDIQIGHHTVEFRHFVRQLNHLEEVLGIFDTNQPKIEKPHTLAIYKEEYQAEMAHTTFSPKDLPSYTSHWIRVLSEAALFEVAEEADRIYSVLGLLMHRGVRLKTQAPSNVGVLIDRYPVDYSKSISSINQDVTKFLINLGNLEIFDYFMPREETAMLQRLMMPSWSSNFAYSADKIGYYQPLMHQRPSYKKPLKQDYGRIGILELEGVSVSKGFSLLDAQKEISHPRERLRPTSLPPISFGELLKEQYREMTTSKSSSSLRIERLSWALVFTHMDETEFSYELRNEVVFPTDLSPGFNLYLKGDDFVFGYIDNDELGLQELTFILPPTASISDVLVSLYGSKCLHLLRPLIEGDANTTFTYVGPVVGMVHDQTYINKYSSSTQLGAKSILKHALHAPGTRKQCETFLIY